MRFVFLALLICAGLAQGCAPLPRPADSADDSSFWHRDAPGTIWKKNRVPDGGD